MSLLVFGEVIKPNKHTFLLLSGHLQKQLVTNDQRLTVT